MKYLLILSVLLISQTILARVCSTAAECDDRIYCNGKEVCIKAAGQPTGICRASSSTPCAAELGMRCIESSKSCEKVMCSNDTQCIDENPCDELRICDPTATGFTLNTLTRVHGCKKAGPNCSGGQVCQPSSINPRGFSCITPACTNPDKDGDGRRAIECGGDDCDDNDARNFPGNPEVCDSEMHDEDCDPRTFGNRDVDGDGFINEKCCNINASGAKICGDDCDDLRGAVKPGAMFCAEVGTRNIFTCGHGIGTQLETCVEGTVCYWQPNGTGICAPER